MGSRTFAFGNWEREVEKGRHQAANGGTAVPCLEARAATTTSRRPSGRLALVVQTTSTHVVSSERRLLGPHMPPRYPTRCRCAASGTSRKGRVPNALLPTGTVEHVPQQCTARHIPWLALRFESRCLTHCTPRACK
jgi:hypothetical protein